jgi:hypothetical protein
MFVNWTDMIPNQCYRFVGFRLDIIHTSVPHVCRKRGANSDRIVTY